MEFEAICEIAHWLKPQLPPDIWREIWDGKWAYHSYRELTEEPELAEYQEVFLVCQRELELVLERYAALSTKRPKVKAWRHKPGKPASL